MRVEPEGQSKRESLGGHPLASLFAPGCAVSALPRSDAQAAFFGDGAGILVDI